MMAGDLLPYFKLYPAETLADERFSAWTFEERGVWLTLLLQAWVNGSVPSDVDTLSRLIRADPGALRSHWKAIGDRFCEMKHLPPGRVSSPRLELERTEARAKVSAAEKAAKSRWGKKKTPNATAMRPQCDRIRSRNAHRSAQPSPDQINTTQPVSQTGLAGENGNSQLAPFRLTLAHRLGLPRMLAVGKDAPRVLECFERQLELVGEDALLVECCDLAKKSMNGVPTSLAWFVNWLERLPSSSVGGVQ